MARPEGVAKALGIVPAREKSGKKDGRQAEVPLFRHRTRERAGSRP
jgi:hypothetical protein